MKFDMETVVNSPITEVFNLLHDYDKRLSWDPFLKEARVLTGPVGVGCKVLCREKKLGLAMETEYVSFRPPRLAAVRMTAGPFFLKDFTGTWLLQDLDEGRTGVNFHYNITARPKFLTPLLAIIFQIESKVRMRELKRYLEANGDTLK